MIPCSNDIISQDISFVRKGNFIIVKKVLFVEYEVSEECMNQ